MKSSLTRSQVILVNIFIFLTLVFLFELALGSWLGTRGPAEHIPATIVGKDLMYDISNIDRGNSAGPSVINYSRDEDGYRGFNRDARSFILTIGGSTTDQRLVSDEATWQRKLEALLPVGYNVINGGVDGQTSFGHLVSVKSWHSISLRDYPVSAVIFYFGLNDLLLLQKGRLGLSEYDDLYENKSIAQIIRIQLSRNSFFYSSLREVYRKISLATNEYAGTLIWQGHGVNRLPQNPHKLAFRVEHPGIHDGYTYYVDLIASLIHETARAFPNARIVLVQQQIPGCLFDSATSGYDLNHSTEVKEAGFESSCKTLGEVFLAQNFAVNNLDYNRKPIVLPMYLDTVLSADDVYDLVHTNAPGSSAIGTWLYERIKEQI